MNDQLEEKLITITAVEQQQWGVKLKDSQNLVYNVSATKKDGQPTVAYTTLQGLENFGMSQQVLLKYATVQNNQGGQSRYVRMVERSQGVVIPKTVQEPQYVPNNAPQATQSPKTSDDKWDKINEKKEKSMRWMNALNNACLLVAHRDKDISAKIIGQIANDIYNLQPEEDIKEKVANAGWANQPAEGTTDHPQYAPEEEISVQNIPF